MDGTRIGRLTRAVRIQRRLTQADVGRLAGVSQRSVTRVEQGDLRSISLDKVERVAAALGISLRLDARWRGGDGDRLIDREHAAVVDLIVSELRRRGWDVELEYTFNHFGERGSVDVIGWHAASRSLLIVEAKSTLTDLQDLLGSMGRKLRIVPDRLAEERGWESVRVGRLIALPGSTANRGIVERHHAIFDASFPARASAARRWLRAPDGPGLAAVWFVSPSRVATPTRPRRVHARRRGPDVV